MKKIIKCSNSTLSKDELVTKLSLLLFAKDYGVKGAVRWNFEETEYKGDVKLYGEDRNLTVIEERTKRYREKAEAVINFLESPQDSYLPAVLSKENQSNIRKLIIILIETRSHFSLGIND